MVQHNDMFVKAADIAADRQKVYRSWSKLGQLSSSTPFDAQTDVFKELVNKLAWVVGSTYKKPYGNLKTSARQYAIVMAQAIVRDHGYPLDE